ncbi:SRPBCC domain-containing protein [Leptospira sp. GIMC2001]|uniref:SRPBCC domain-containing protein n=1 Tax=Leptospira sp. GIMC2001 TaxID=1513297 RepID=UPI0023492FA4|nr:SRPBCC domain-containing protein [Leptospira sp. GIMC2001]WCL50620.1 SRPBCC domain-containing protein [Leptospira sp. GIMC2001]
MKSKKNEVKIVSHGETEVVFQRFFEAPRELVFDCHTKPELMRRWLIGPEGMVLETCEQNLTVGGKYLYLYSDSEGNKSGVYGTFREVIVPEKIANTENYIMDMSSFDPNAPEDPDATFESRTFTTEKDGTLMTHLCRYASADICKMMVETGAADGMAECYLKLDTLLSDIHS